MADGCYMTTGGPFQPGPSRRWLAYRNGSEPNGGALPHLEAGAARGMPELGPARYYGCQRDKESAFQGG